VRAVGLNTDTAWGQFDQAELITRAAAVTPLPLFRVTSLIRSRGGAATLTWGSISGANYQVTPSPALESGWATIALGIAGTATTTTDSAVPANATRRFHNIARTDMGGLGITTRGRPLAHTLFHAVLPYLNGEWAVRRLRDRR